ncbi:MULTISPECIES: SRPBCC family protein [unclassified Kitasatospora]|uniref:SRPBCC family protein n=1 Tax=unclassified Kitasatospora TaxID=2633591 RepID=UPI001ADED7AD|nr:SRPBCC family protein [Kitasatospora sp. RG8]MBP0455563.1 SRPBCC family protein [Kitasatospora sp. RG8]
MGREWSVEESVTVAAGPAAAYRAVSEVRRTGEWSPECRAVWARRGSLRAGERFVGFNRRGLFVWFTTCRVTVADPDREFAFRVDSFGIPIAEWGYRFAADGNGGTTVTEYWRDLRTGRSAPFAELLGKVFTGVSPERRPAANRAGMRATLDRLRNALAG